MSSATLERVYELTASICDGSNTEPLTAELDALLAGNAEARLAYMRYLDAHLEINRRQSESNADRGSRNAEVPAPGSAAPQPIPIYRKGHEPKPSRIRPVHYAVTATAAALLIACGVAIYVLVFSLPHSELPDPASNAPLATLIEATEGAQLTTPGGFISEGRDYPRGEYSIDRGSAEFMLTNSVNVKLRGETNLYMRNNMNVALTRGSAEFVVPNGAEGFTVRLPDGTRVIDLGTRFRVRLVESEPAVVDVLEGSVEVIVDDTAHRVEAGRTALVHSRAGERHLTVRASAAHRAAAYRAAVLADAPLAYWPLDESPDAAEVTDASGNGYTAAPHGVKFAVDGPFDGTRAAVFDGVASIGAGLRPEFAFANDFTVEAWVWIDPAFANLGAIVTAISASDREVTGGWLVGYDAATDQRPARLLLGNQRSRSAILDAPPIETARWVHVAVTHDTDNTTRFYIDGERVHSVPDVGPALPDQTHLTIGRYAAGYGGWIGRLAHVAIYERTLTDKQLRAHVDAAAIDKDNSDTSNAPPGDG